MTSHFPVLVQALQSGGVKLVLWAQNWKLTVIYLRLKLKNKKYLTIGTNPKSNLRIVERTTYRLINLKYLNIGAECQIYFVQ